LAWSIGHFEPGIASVAAVLRDATGGPVAAINASGQVAGFEAPEGRARIGAAIREAAAEISARLGWAEAARQVALEGAA
jgi:DNA-binding IclR family transcriptional regulator